MRVAQDQKPILKNVIFLPPAIFLGHKFFIGVFMVFGRIFCVVFETMNLNCLKM
jgi:hypothetical protein